MDKFVETSSEDEIIQRKRQVYHNEEHSDSLVDDEDYGYDQLDPLFFEIFGTGNEYNYIYDKTVDEQVEKTEDAIPVDEFECFEYVKKYIDYVDKDVVEALFRGECVEYVSFHMDTYSMVETLNIKKYVDEYTEFTRLKRQDKYKNAFTIENLTALKLFQEAEVDLAIPGILPMSKFIENITVQERLYDPEGVIHADFFTSPEFDQVANQLARNPVFVERVYRFYEEALRIYISSNQYNKSMNLMKLEVVKDLESQYLERLDKFYISSDIDSDGNAIRKKLIKKAFSKINSDYFFTVYENLLNNGQIPGINGLQDVVNCVVSIRGRPGHYIGLYLDKMNIYAVSLDEKGTLIEKRVFKNMRDLEELIDWTVNSENLIICSSTPGIRTLVKTLNRPVRYLTSDFSLFNDYGEFSTSYNIAFAVQNPALYFSRAIYEKKNVILNGKVIPHDLLKQAITISAATNKIDWLSTLVHQYGFTFFKLIGISLSEHQIDFEGITSLTQLDNEIFSEVDLNKIYSYFKLMNSKNILDRQNVHPKNYSVCYVIASALVAHLGKSMNSQDEMVAFLLENLKVAKELNMTEIDLPSGLIHPLHALEMLQPVVKWFQGVNDRMVFEDILPQNIVDVETNMHGILGVSSGVVFNNSGAHVIVDVHSARVFCRTDEQYEINQIVKVKILEPVYDRLNYNGIIEERPSLGHAFKNHRLYREEVPEDIPIFIRKSRSSDRSCIVVSKMENGIFFQYKLDEKQNDNEVNYQMIRGDATYSFDSIDNFLETYLKPTNRYLHKLSTFKHFKESRAAAEEWVRDKGDFKRYASYFSLEHPGHLEMLFGECRLTLRIELNHLVFKKRCYGSIEEFSNFCKKTYPNIQ